MAANASPSASDGRGISLVGLLAISIFAELWLNRIAARMARLDPAGPLAGVVRHLDVPALFSFEFASVFAGLLLAGSVGRVILSKRERGPLRLSFAMVGGVVTTLVLTGIFVRLPARFAAHLVLGALFLLLVLALAFVSSPASRLWRAGVLLLVLPIAVMHAANLVQRFSAPGVLDPTASILAEIAGVLFVLVGLASPWLLAAEGAAGWFPLSLSALVAMFGLLFGKLDWDFCARLAAIGFGVSIPTHPVGLPLYVIGAAGFAYTIATLVPRSGPDRLAGVGVLVICLVGLQLELPYQVATSLVGFLCLLASATRPAPNAITRAEFDDMMKRIASVVGAVHVTIAGDEGRERARLGFTVGADLPATLQIDRRAGAVAALDLSIGIIAERAPPFSLASHAGASLGPSAHGPVVEIGEATFDDRYTVRDHRSAGTALLDVETRHRILRLVDGWLGVWPQRGARYRSTRVPSGDDGFPSLSQLLADLVTRSGS